MSVHCITCCAVQAAPELHIGLRTGYCGSLTTFASWEYSLVTGLIGGESPAAELEVYQGNSVRVSGRLVTWDANMPAHSLKEKMSLLRPDHMHAHHEAEGASMSGLQPWAHNT